MSVVSSLISSGSCLLMAAFFVLAVWALVGMRQGTLPPAYFLGVNLTHGLYVLVLLVGLVGVVVGTPKIGKFWEYLALFTGGGVVYMRGLFNGGWLWRVLTDPPRVPYGMLLGAGWCFAAVLGYVFFLAVPAGSLR